MGQMSPKELFHWMTRLRAQVCGIPLLVFPTIHMASSWLSRLEARQVHTCWPCLRETLVRVDTGEDGGEEEFALQLDDIYPSAPC